MQNAESIKSLLKCHTNAGAINRSFYITGVQRSIQSLKRRAGGRYELVSS